eukprot:TRINITY_DN14748_c0_g1_i1.p1 TRINITY_DN14748_c0_g1~~TRINITY_DN14748_c0_g1_i1.p1  ORF type:complete len:408 (-),score=85.43 TRINITY_DN14748_c0_g1_i1:62-1285(-)
MLYETNSDLSEAQKTSFGIPSDISFKILDFEKGCEFEIKAHRYYLSTASPVFKALLFSSWYESKDVINIEGTTKDAFQTMLDYVYNKKIDTKTKTASQLQEIEKLSVWYHLPGLTALVTRNGKTKTGPDPTFGIPTDVTFNIIENGKASGNGIDAHMYHLALATPVFKAQFFGAARETKDIIPIKGTTRRAFKTMIDYIYGKQLEWKHETVSQLFAILNLGEMYDLMDLKKIAEEKLAEFPLTKYNVIEVAFEAENHVQFKEISDIVLKHCKLFLAKTILKTRADIVHFASEYASSPRAMTAFKLLGGVPACQNCYQTPCLKGEQVRFDQIVQGSKVSSFNDYITGTVLCVSDEDDIKVKCMDGVVRSFNSEGPPRDADVVQNPIYFHNSFFLTEEKTSKGGIYWNC